MKINVLPLGLILTESFFRRVTQRLIRDGDPLAQKFVAMGNTAIPHIAVKMGARNVSDWGLN